MTTRTAAEHRHAAPPTTKEHVRQMADIFGLLADPTRLLLLVELADEELCVGDLASRAGVGDTVASHALRLLRAHGIVRPRRDGNRIYYSLVDEHVRVLVEATATHVRQAHT